MVTVFSKDGTGHMEAVQKGGHWKRDREVPCLSGYPSMLAAASQGFMGRESKSF
jgi:hypothetical protein